MLITPVACGVVGIALTLSPFADFLGFTALPLEFFAILICMTFCYLALVEFAKARFYRWQGHPVAASRTPPELHEHRVVRRRARFIEHSVGGRLADRVQTGDRTLRPEREERNRRTG